MKTLNHLDPDNIHITNCDMHVRDYYSQPANDFEEFYSSKFTGQTVACAVAYRRSLEGFQYDDFGNSERNGYYCRVLFDDCPYIVCFAEYSDGTVREIFNTEYEAAFAEELTEALEDDEFDYNDDKNGNYVGPYQEYIK